MKFLLFTLAVMILVIPQAQARDGRITVSDIRSFVAYSNASLNNPNVNVGREFLDRTLTSDASFRSYVTLYPGNWQGMQGVWYSNNYYANTHYRYPYNYAPYYNRTSARTFTKWDQIDLFKNKKNLIAGYQSEMVVTNTFIPPYSNSAIVDVDLKEYSLNYTPYNRYLTGKVKHAHSVCKMYLTKQGQRVSLTRMDCNTNSNITM